jgi:hypothetical protein
MQIRLCLPPLVIIVSILIINTSISPSVFDAFGQKNTASDLYETKSLKLSPNIKHLVILIPNEGHESQNPGDISSDQRLINQPYIPQQATVNPGTMVIWFNGDVDHDHKITLANSVNSENAIFDSGTTSASNSINSPGIQGNADTAGVLMVPKSDIDTDVQDLKNRGFAIDSTQDFNDIRAGDQQALLVWTTSGIDLDAVVSTLQEITQNLPYS